MMATVAADAGTLIMTRNYDRVSLGNGVSRLEECSAILCNLGPKKEVKGMIDPTSSLPSWSG